MTEADNQHEFDSKVISENSSCFLFFTAKVVKIDQIKSESNSLCLDNAATIKQILRPSQKVFEK